MKKRVSIISLIVIGCFIGCDKDDNEVPSPTHLLTVTVDLTFNTELTDNWVIVHDEQGVLLEFKAFESGDQILLETIKPVAGNTIGVTTLKYAPDSGGQYYNLTSYLKIDKGETLHLKPYQFQVSPPSTGSFYVKGSGLNVIDEINMTSKFGLSCGGSAGAGKVDFTCGTGMGRYLLHVSDVLGNLRYKFFDGMKPDDMLTFSFNDMTEFDKTVVFTFPESKNVSMFSTAREPDQSYADAGYVTSFHFTGDSHTQIKAGYLDGLTKYYTNLTVGYPTYRYVYNNRGSIPNANITWPTATNFSLVSKAIESFNSSAKVPFTWRFSTWMYQSAQGEPVRRIYWDVSSPSTSQTFAELPAEIVAAHPVLVFDNLKHSSTTFYTQSNPYSTFIRQMFDADPERVGVDIGIGIW